MVASTLIPNPAVLRVISIRPTTEAIVLVLATSPTTAACPQCGRLAARVHSRYQRTLADLPWNGIPVRLQLGCRRFFCDHGDCSQRIFTERLPGVACRSARRTQRLAQLLFWVGHALGGEAGARLAEALGLRTSPDTLRRQLRRHTPPTPSVRVLGVDDWAWRKGQRYGTLLVDLEARRVLDLLPDRQAATLATWLKKHPEVEVVCRDRSSVYADGVRQGAPQAQQVADRWHLLHNLLEALANFLARQPAALRVATQESARASPTAAAVASACSPTGSSPARSAPSQRRGGRCSQVAPYRRYLQRRWRAGVRNCQQLWRELLDQGFTGSHDAVSRYLAPWRDPPPARGRPRASPAPPGATGKRGVSPRRVAGWLLRDPAELEAEQHRQVERILAHSPLIAQAQALAIEFFRIVREQEAPALAGWLERAAQSGIGEFQGLAVGLRGDAQAVQAALVLPWSNGQTEGQVQRLKAIKRQMYGRAGFDLLRARVLPAA